MNGQIINTMTGKRILYYDDNGTVRLEITDYGAQSYVRDVPTVRLWGDDVSVLAKLLVREALS
jgi:hypothetical protein